MCLYLASEVTLAVVHTLLPAELASLWTYFPPQMKDLLQALLLCQSHSNALFYKAFLLDKESQTPQSSILLEIQKLSAWIMGEDTSLRTNADCLREQLSLF